MTNVQTDLFPQKCYFFKCVCVCVWGGGGGLFVFFVFCFFNGGPSMLFDRRANRAGLLI